MTGAAISAPVAYPCDERISASVAYSWPNTYPVFERAPCAKGSSPVMIVAWEGRVLGDAVMAFSKSNPSLAIRSMWGEVGRRCP